MIKCSFLSYIFLHAPMRYLQIVDWLASGRYPA